MEIKTIDVQFFATASLNISNNGLRHEKSLPYLSIVQATEGHYEIGIGPDKKIRLNEMGAFIAPAYQMQYITHHTNPCSSRMKAHWIFLDVIINHNYHLDEVFRFPTILPAKYENTVCQSIENITMADSLCLKLSEIYRLIQILTDIGTVQEPVNSRSRKVTAFINRNITERLTPDILARELNVSIPTLYRICHQNFQMSPSNYVNSIRLIQASSLLETTDESITNISEMVGFYDQSFFSRLFKKKYGIPPSDYRKKTL